MREPYHKLYPAGSGHLLIHHVCYAVLQRDSLWMCIHIFTIKVHTFFRASLYEQIELQAKLLNYFLGSNKSNINQIRLSLSYTSEASCSLLVTHCLFFALSSPLSILLSPYLMQTEAFGRYCAFFWPTSACMLIFDCNLDCACVYVVFWSLRVPTQDWVAKACAPVPDASKSLVGASTHCTQYTRMSMRTAHDQEDNIYPHLHMGAIN